MVPSTRPTAKLAAHRSKRGGSRGFILAAVAVATISAILVFFIMSKRGHAQPENVQVPHSSHDIPPVTTTIEHPLTGSQSPESQKQTSASSGPPANSPQETAPGSGAEISDRHDRIAKTHAELVALEKQGTRHYVEFSVKRSKHFQAVGPLAIQLRKADVRHSYCDLRLNVNGRSLDKKHVNLYEPIWITPDEHGRPIEFVVNGVRKNRISGYLSEPRNGNVRLARK